MRKDEGGYIVVETVGCFLLFVFLMASILSLINIVTVQSRVHYAMTQTAETVSMYSYTLELLGVESKLQASAAKGDKARKDVETVKDNINSVLKAIEEVNIQGLEDAASDSYDHASSFVSSVKDDPKGVLQQFMNLGLQELSSQAFEHAIIKPLVERYLGNGEVSGDDFLRAFNVVDGIDGLEFASLDMINYNSETHRFDDSRTDSTLINADGDLVITVEYKINYTFGALPLPFAELEIRQEVKTKPWTGGLGKGYSASN